MNHTLFPLKEALDHLEQNLREAYRRIAELEAGPKVLPTDEACADTVLNECVHAPLYGTKGTTIIYTKAAQIVAQHREAHTAALEEQLRIAVDALETLKDIKKPTLLEALTHGGNYGIMKERYGSIKLEQIAAFATDALQQIAALKEEK